MEKVLLGVTVLQISAMPCLETRSQWDKSQKYLKNAQPRKSERITVSCPLGGFEIIDAGMESRQSTTMLLSVLSCQVFFVFWVLFLISLQFVISDHDLKTHLSNLFR